MSRLLAASLVFACLASAAETWTGWRREGDALCTGEWCGCKAGPAKCQRPCSGCCGGDEGVCFSGMDPTTCHGPASSAR